MYDEFNQSYGGRYSAFDYFMFNVYLYSDSIQMLISA